MPLNEAMLNNMTADELAHYVACTPDVKPGLLMGAVAEKLEDLKGEVFDLELELQNKEDEHTLDYYDFSLADNAVKEVLAELRMYCKDFADDHPLAKICYKLEAASSKVNNLI